MQWSLIKCCKYILLLLLLLLYFLLENDCLPQNPFCYALKWRLGDKSQYIVVLFDNESESYDSADLKLMLWGWLYFLSLSFRSVISRRLHQWHTKSLANNISNGFQQEKQSASDVARSLPAVQCTLVAWSSAWCQPPKVCHGWKMLLAFAFAFAFAVFF